MDASDRARVEIAIEGPTVPKAFLPAFRDTDDGRPVAMIRMPQASGRIFVHVRVDGLETNAGMVTL